MIFIVFSRTEVILIVFTRSALNFLLLLATDSVKQ